MSKFRTLFPEPDPSVPADLIPKLEKALILCEMLQSSSSSKFFETKLGKIYSSGVPFSHENIREADSREKHFKLIKVHKSAI